MMDALDLSNNTTHFTVDHVRQWKADGIELAIVQLISGVRLAGDDCATQIRTCLDGGLAVDCYIFPRNDGLPMGPREKLALVPAELKPEIRQLWCDVEPAFNRDPSYDQVDEVLIASDEWAPHQRTGTYSALWVADKFGWHPWPWPDRKQWLVYVRFDGAPNLNGGFDGTNNHVMTQYRMDVVEAGVAGMDRNRLMDTETQAVRDWLNGGSSEPDVADCQQYKDALARVVNRIQIEDERKTAAGKPASIRRTIIREIASEAFQALQA